MSLIGIGYSAEYTLNYGEVIVDKNEIRKNIEDTCRNNIWNLKVLKIVDSGKDKDGNKKYEFSFVITDEVAGDVMNKALNYKLKFHGKVTKIK